MKRIFLFLIICIFTYSCASNKYTKQGATYEAAGMYEMAVSSYSTALIKKVTNANARIGLMRSATKYSENLQEKVEECYQASNDDGVVENYLKLDALVNSMLKFNIDIIVNTRATGQYNESKNRFLIQKYATGQEALEKENFNEAADLFKQVISVDANYENAQSLLVISLCEPLYREAMIHMENSKYRTAYALFNNIITIDATYKDAVYQQNIAVINGVLTIYYMPITGSNKYVNESNAIMGQVKNIVAKKNDPFLRFLDEKTTVQSLIKDKSNMLSNMENTSTIIPIRANLKSKITINKETSQLSNEKKKGFLRITNKDKTTTNKSITYYERAQSRSITINYSFEVISTVSGEVLMSDSYSQTKTDNIHFIYYDGTNEKNVYSSDGKSVGSSLKYLAKARKTLLAYDELETKAIDTITKEMAQTLISYNPEK